MSGAYLTIAATAMLVLYVVLFVLDAKGKL